MEEKQFVEVTVSVTLSKSLCVEVPINATSEQIIEKAKPEFILPQDSMQILNNVAKQMNLRFGKVNIADATRDWYVDDIAYATDYRNPESSSGEQLDA